MELGAVEMAEALLVGVDGGGTKCRVRIRDLAGNLVGAAEGGTANVFAGVEAAVRTIVETTRDALAKAGLAPEHAGRCFVGLGLAGANVPSVADALGCIDLPFAGHGLETDAATACRGAFAGRDGAIAILGTGSAYAVRLGGETSLLGGWGMLLSDQGSGADLGRRALSVALLTLDGILPEDGLCADLLDRFDRSAPAIVEFARDALPRDFGAFAPLVLSHAGRGDAVANKLVTDGLPAIEAMLHRLLALGAPAIALGGGLAPFYRPLIRETLAATIVEPQGDAMEGALGLARSVWLTDGTGR